MKIELGTVLGVARDFSRTGLVDSGVCD